MGIGLGRAIFADHGFDEAGAVFAADRGELAFGADAVGDAHQRVGALGGDGVDKGQKELIWVHGKWLAPT